MDAPKFVRIREVSRMTALPEVMRELRPYANRVGQVLQELNGGQSVIVKFDDGKQYLFYRGDIIFLENL